MQRDMDLIRNILLEMEAHENGYAPPSFTFEDRYTQAQIGYHIWLMGQAGLMEVYSNTTNDDNSPSAVPLCLTWEGYEFIGAAKNECAWRKSTALVLAKAGAIGFDILKAVLTAEARRQLGLPLA